MSAERSAATCDLWGCGKTAITPITVSHPDHEGDHVLVVCDYHSMMVRDGIKLAIVSASLRAVRG